MTLFKQTIFHSQSFCFVDKKRSARNGGAMALLSLDRMSPDELFHCLHSREQEVYQRFPSHLRKCSYLGGRACAKEALHHMAAFPTVVERQDVWIDNGAFGQPLINSEYGTAEASVSISHSNNFAAALAFPRAYPMGIDIEEVVRTDMAALTRCMTRKEEQLLNTYSDEMNKEVLAVVMWSAKECVAKMIGTGFTLPFTVFELAQVKKAGNMYQITFSKLFPFRVTSCYNKEAGYVLSVGYPQTVSSIKSALAFLLSHYIENLNSINSYVY